VYEPCPSELQDSPIAPVSVFRVVGGEGREDRDVLAVEEPLQIRILWNDGARRRQRTISITMRTPGADAELAAGFLFTEGVINDRRDILAIMPCQSGNLIRVHLRDDAVESCTQFELPPASPVVSADIIRTLPDRLRAVQPVFDRTGGLHASALFDSQGEMQAVREDVGRHNALDKLIGRSLLRGHVPLISSVLLVSGRVSFELVQKAAMAGIPILAAVGAPSSLAVQLAEKRGMTLLGFLRQDRFNIYSRPQRIQFEGTGQ
jgi:FdhD protein